MSEGVKKWGDCLSLDELRTAISNVNRVSFTRGDAPLGLIIERVDRLETAGKLTREKALAERKRLRKLAGQG